MENRRFILIGILGALLFFIYQAWQKDYPAAAPVPATAAAPAADVPKAAATETSAAAATPADAQAADTGERIRVETDLFIAEIAARGGELRRLQLKDYAAVKDQPARMALLDDEAGRLFVLQSGLAGPQAPLSSPDTVYSSAQSSYQLSQGNDQLEVLLTHQNADGVLIRKTYVFKRGSYQIDLAQSVQNASAAPLSLSPYVRLLRTAYQQGGEPRFAHTFTGVGFYQQAEAGSAKYKFKKTALDKLDKEKVEQAQTGGWISILQHYFVAAIIPPADEAVTYSARPRSSAPGYIAQYVGNAVSVAPGAEQRFATRLYIGPKLQDHVAEVAPGFELTLDYGLLSFIAKYMFLVLKFFHGLTANWGVAIILLTLVVKLALYKLSEAQYRSMARMKVFSPKIQEIRERYADDRERQQKAMMDLYKKEGFNPLAGCWPILVQFPVFISLYWVLLESVELRQAPFALWLQDLSAPDPFYVLPVLYGITMFLQQRLSGNQTMDPTQQRVMQIMPIALTAFFAFFQSGLVLYWVVNGLISIAQQWYIMRKLDREGAKK
ncbi:YidC/Oxa1 family membrane protein insertase [Solimonas aquatica]|uniref:Membrane protein insertase YidC n=1 Tax=Solimonas aquatica TaxID=489703 RepID=A0A1H9KTM5_9GAMM|nr:membrane protein insertase YidC [Solimonas aquatica]SER02267.1 YidC/Oxa1 family membrane protein insertase [Solimonas aquatica]